MILVDNDTVESSSSKSVMPFKFKFETDSVPLIVVVPDTTILLAKLTLPNSSTANPGLENP
jgi:hypothetical protein